MLEKISIIGKEGGGGDTVFNLDLKTPYFHDPMVHLQVWNLLQNGPGV